MIMEKKCSELKIVKVERCCMDQLMKNLLQMFLDLVKSYKSLPQLLYHIQWKFRDEIRPRFGVARCKEFYMKDAYSF